MFENDPKGNCSIAIVVEIVNVIVSQDVLSVTCTMDQIAILLVDTQTLGCIVKMNASAMNCCASLKVDAKVKPYLHIIQQVDN